MFKEKYTVLGVMSGTSLDGIDLARIVFTICNNKWEFEILESETVSYSMQWLNKLKTALSLTHEELAHLDKDYTQLLAAVINDFLKIKKIKNLDAICSHGHTILHQPQNGYTLQIGNLPLIATLTKNTVICDFRVQDVKLGGQGAPLVPIGDQILFSDYEYCMNLGGFSNISFIENEKRVAFDVTPVNTVLNYYATLLGFDYDNKGLMAKSGKCQNDLLNELNELPFYKLSYPKSLGFEFVKETVLPLMEQYNIPIEDKLNTFIKHVATQVSRALNSKEGKILVTGGGAYNDFLIEKIKEQLPEMEIIIPDRKTLEFKEALIFGFLGVLKLRGEINVLSSVTGAIHDHCSGKIYNQK
ncbi:MAG: anhydro-N-acetylmuramic acid kinase [Flavobacteriaceae bacterium]|nr:anhydro-N-acetylmuramic acid kinase [Flavobacteriaceae bacterium]